MMHSIHSDSTLFIQNPQGGFREASGCYGTLIRAVVVALVSENAWDNVENIAG